MQNDGETLSNFCLTSGRFDVSPYMRNYIAILAPENQSANGYLGNIGAPLAQRRLQRNKMIEFNAKIATSWDGF